ncbi:hypothetical protein [Nonomuraea rhizosphaerae]|uniref:hypothetical protein n=1 Tax=Nonomuraea rhizosphaerae TaxID=2665663 RepID=UPI001FE4A1BF|nr:hypothetical protein [Nonomuraea rhizosphaerae]
MPITVRTCLIVTCARCGGTGDPYDSEHHTEQTSDGRQWLRLACADWQWSDADTPELCPACVRVADCERDGHQWSPWRPASCESCTCVHYRQCGHCEATERACQCPASAHTRPTIVCLCGSTRFFDEFRRQNLRLTLAGQIVLSIGCDTKADADLAEIAALGNPGDLAQVKNNLDQLHRDKIRLADEVLVLNVGGYIGESTRAEIAYATELGKPVHYLHPAPQPDRPDSTAASR